MSFYGSIGCLMTDSGLPSLLELIYAEHTVPHILFGKGFSRATRGHLISTGVLSALITSIIYNCNMDTDTEGMKIFVLVFCLELPFFRNHSLHMQNITVMGAGEILLLNLPFAVEYCM